MSSNCFLNKRKALFKQQILHYMSIIESSLKVIHSIFNNNIYFTYNCIREMPPNKYYSYTSLNIKLKFNISNVFKYPKTYIVLHMQYHYQKYIL